MVSQTVVKVEKIQKGFKQLPNGDSKCSAIKQVASGRFGVTSEYLCECK